MGGREGILSIRFDVGTICAVVYMARQPGGKKSRDFQNECRKEGRECPDSAWITEEKGKDGLTYNAKTTKSY